MQHILRAFEQALSQGPSIRTETYYFGGRPVRLRVLGEGFGRRTHRAFDHLRMPAPSGAAELRIDLWDQTEVGVDTWTGDAECDLERQWVACDGTLTASADGRYVSFRYLDSVLMLDRLTQRIVGCRRNGAHLTGGDYSKPLLLVLSIWYQDRGIQLLHAGLVGHTIVCESRQREVALLVPGLSGTGKSTTSLAALVQGMEFLGDDFVGLARRTDGGFDGHSIYNSICLTRESLGRFPELQSFAVDDDQQVEEKPIVFSSDIYPERVRTRMRVGAVVLLRIGNDRTQIQQARPGEALRQITASTLHTLVPRPGREAFRIVAELVEQVPAWWLLLGPDIQDIRPALERIAEASEPLLPAAPATLPSETPVLTSEPSTSPSEPGTFPSYPATRLSEPVFLPAPAPAAGDPRPRLLVLAESLPWPTLKGGDFRTWQNVCALSKWADVGVFGLCSNDTRRHRAPDLDLKFWKASADPALASPPPKGVRLSSRAWLLDEVGHPSDLFYSATASEELTTLLEDFRPDIVVMEGLWLRRYIDLFRSFGCRLVLDCHNIEAIIHQELARDQVRHDLESRVLRDVLPERTRAIEEAAIGRVDQVWVCSDEDAGQLRDMYRPRAPVVVLPNTIRLEDYVRPAAPAARAPSPAELILLYTGIFAYRPNGYAASFLLNEILPRLTNATSLPLQLQLIGPMPTDEMLAAASQDSRVIVMGAVPDVRPYLAAGHVMPVPLFHGSGTRLKVLEAFAAGIPVVSTAKGVEGLSVEHGTHALIAETADAFVESILAIWQDPDLSCRLVTRARRLVEARFSWDVVGPRIRGAVSQLHATRAIA